MEGAGGVRAVILPDAVPDGTPIRIVPVGDYDLTRTSVDPADFQYIAGIDLNMPEGVTAAEEIHLSMPLPDGWGHLTEDDTLLLMKEIAVDGAPEMSLVNIARIVRIHPPPVQIAELSKLLSN